MARQSTRKVTAKRGPGRPAGSGNKRRVRRELKPRNPRTYYAVSADGKNLYRFGNHAHRLSAIKADGLQPVGALEFRNMQAEDVDGKLQYHDLRKEVRISRKTEASTPAPVATAGTDLSTLIAQAVNAAVQSALQKVQAQPRSDVAAAGEQPNANRSVPSH